LLIILLLVCCCCGSGFGSCHHSCK
jgi:hypothetical protein